MSIGKLDRRITFIEPTISTGTSNEDKITGWTQLASIPDVWAAKLERAGSVYAQADRLTYAQQTEWTIRNRTDLNIRMRVVADDSRVYEISSITEAKGSRERYLKIVTNLVDNTFWT